MTNKENISKLSQRDMYSQMIPSGNALQSCQDYISDKCNCIHKQMYEYALAKFIRYRYHDIDSEHYDITEIKNKDWKSAPYVLVTTKTWPYSQKRYSLEEFWDPSFIQEKTSSWKSMNIDEDSMKDAEITSIDYVNAKVTMESRLTGNKFEVPFSRINEDTKVNDEKCTLVNTFTYLSNNQ